MNKIQVVRKAIIILSIILFLFCYLFIRRAEYSESIYRDFSDVLQFRGPLAFMTFLSPHIYLMLILAIFLHVLRGKHDVVKQLMWIWAAIFMLGSAWTTLLIYAVNNG
ncbi:hypothetical protein BS630_13790 [Rhizobium laguerreae]|nr:hypothetical protein BS630_13790 [Rhizobium laguerreae]